ncbi:hypothetical protein H6H02_26235 [Coleofasciculus sp. FACHB-1120]|nr:hypothetical protein [Coleofasciculus sp. FACHB-1120]
MRLLIPYLPTLTASVATLQFTAVTAIRGKGSEAATKCHVAARTLDKGAF